MSWIRISSSNRLPSSVCPFVIGNWRGFEAVTKKLTPNGFLLNLAKVGSASQWHWEPRFCHRIPQERGWSFQDKKQSGFSCLHVSSHRRPLIPKVGSFFLASRFGLMQHWCISYSKKSGWSVMWREYWELRILFWDWKGNNVINLVPKFNHVDWPQFTRSLNMIKDIWGLFYQWLNAAPCQQQRPYFWWHYVLHIYPPYNGPFWIYYITHYFVNESTFLYMNSKV